MDLLSRIKNVQRTIKPVTGTKLGDDVYVKELTGEEIEQLNQSLRKAGRATDRLSRTDCVIASLCDKDGVAALTVENPEHVAAVSALGDSTLRKLFEAAAEVNEWTGGDEPDPSDGV